MKILNEKMNIIVVSTILITLSVVFNITAIKNILFDVYKWHMVQPETIQGGLELIVFFILIALILIHVNKTRALFLVPILMLIYLQLHQVFLPALLAVLYFEMIISIGHFVWRIFKNNKQLITLDTYIQLFIFGFVTWCLFAIVLSACGFGEFNHLRIMTIGLYICSLFKGVYTPLSFYILKNAYSVSKFSKVGLSFVLTIIMMQFAKTNRALDYDSLWYGLRPEQVLIGNNSFFDNIGMVMAVHYYPKLFELFAVPLSDIGDYSFVLSVNILFYAFVLIVIFLFSRYVTNNSNYSVLILALLASVPAIANMASTAKTDIFSVFFIIAAAYYLWIWNKDNHLFPLILGLSSSILSLGGKITSVMYIPLLIFGFVLLFIVRKIKDRKLKVIEVFNEKVLGCYLLLSSVFIILAICYRTYKLTGYPFYPLLGSLWAKLGFQIKYPFLGSNSEFFLSDDKSLLHHWAKILFDPQGYNHYVMVWPSNLYLFVWIISLIVILSYYKKMKLKEYSLFIVFLPIMLSGIYNISTLPYGGDGNYYIPVVVFTLIAFFVLIKVISQNIRKVIIISMIMFIPVQSYVMMVSHFSWSYGTSKFSSDITQSNLESYDTKLKLFEGEGILEIETYLSQKNETANCISFLRPTGGQEQLLNQLSCRYEDIPHMSSRYGNSELFSSSEEFKKYLEWANVKYIIMPKGDVEGYEGVKAIINGFEQSPNTKRVDTSNYYLLEIDQRDIESITGITNSFDTAKLLEGWYPKESNYRWIAKEANGVFKSGMEGTLIIKGIVPDIFDNIELSVQINNQEKKIWTLKKGDFTVEINKEIPLVTDVDLTISLNKSFIPKEIGRNEDSRELGIVIKDLIFK